MNRMISQKPLDFHLSGREGIYSWKKWCATLHVCIFLC